jgi:hypothetical protein
MVGCAILVKPGDVISCACDAARSGEVDSAEFDDEAADGRMIKS